MTIKQSHGGSGSQARAVIDGLDADVVTLALWTDTDAIRKKGLIKEGWEERLPERVAAVLLDDRVRGAQGQSQGDPRLARSVKDDVAIITPNPKTSGNGKLSFLAAWGSVIVRGGTEEKPGLVTRLYQHAPVLDSGARGATTTFAQKEIGDVHLTWENEAHLEVQEAGGELEIVYPPREHPGRAARRRRRCQRQSQGHAGERRRPICDSFTPTQAQEIIARHHYRPINDEVRASTPRRCQRLSCSRSPRSQEAGTKRISGSLRRGACSTGFTRPSDLRQRLH